MGYILVESDRREATTVVLEDTRFKSEWNVYDTLSDGEIEFNIQFYPKILRDMFQLKSATVTVARLCRYHRMFETVVNLCALVGGGR